MTGEEPIGSEQDERRRWTVIKVVAPIIKDQIERAQTGVPLRIPRIGEREQLRRRLKRQIQVSGGKGAR